MNAANELRVWASHLAGQSVTILHREVPFDSAGRSAVLTREEFDRATGIPCFATDGPVPSSRDFLPAAFTVTDWLCCLGVSRFLVESLTDEQRELLSIDLRGIGGPFNVSHEEFAAKMGRPDDSALPVSTPDTEPTLDDYYFAQTEAEDDTEALPEEGEAPDLEEFTREVLEEVVQWGEGGFQHPDAVVALGAEEPEGEPSEDMVTEFNGMNVEARAEFVADGGLSRGQLDSLFNVEANGRRSKKVLTAITTEIQKLPNPTADSINQALVTASAGPRQPEE